MKTKKYIINTGSLWPVISQFLLLSMLFAVPLAFGWFMKSSNVFEVNKALWFHIGTLIFSFSVLGSLFFGHIKQGLLNWRSFRRYLLVPAAFMAFWLASLLWSDNPLVSYFGLNDRQFGIKNLLFCGLFFVSSYLHLASMPKAWWRQVVIAIVLSADIVAVYAVLQIIGIDLYKWTEPAWMTYRSTSSFGQPNYLASYLVLMMPVAVLGLFSAKRWYSRYFWITSLVIQFLALLSTGSRSGWLAFAVGFASLFAYLIFHWRKPLLAICKKRPILPIIAAIAILFSIGLLLFTSNPISDRISSSKNLKEGSVAARLNIWQAAWEGIKEHPISGYGWENQEKAIGSHYKSDWALFGEVNSASNRAHNLILDAWLCGGILGVIFLLSWYCQFFYLAFSGKKDENIDDYLAWKLLLALSALMYVITLAFGFAVVGTEMYIWFFLAVLSALDARRSISSKPYDLGMPKRLAVLSLLFLGILSLWQSSLEIAIVRADIAFRDMREQLSIKNYPQAISAYQDISFSFDKDPMHAYYLADNLPINSKLVASPLAAQLLQTVAVSLLDQPGNIGLDKYYVEAKIYSFLGNKESAIASIDKAIAIAPEWPKAKFLKASILADMGDYQAAEKYFSETEAVLPPFEEFWPDLERWGKSTEYYRSLAFIGRGDSKLALGDYAGAEIDYKAALRSHPLDISLYKKISNTFFLRNDWQEAIRYNLFGFARQPNEYAWPFAVAILYDKAGNSALAKDYAGKALSLMPAGYSKESPVIKALEEIINKD